MLIKEIISEITSFFENGTTEIQYSYISNLRDGRGYTCGRCGFTTGTGDALEVVHEYEKVNPNNSLSEYIPELERLDTLPDADKGDVSHLQGFSKAWRAECHNELFKKVQDNINDQLYFTPAARLVKKLRLTSPLALAVIYDTIIQHGEGTDEDSIGAIIRHTPCLGTEKEWLLNFLEMRRQDLLNPYNKDTKDVWKESVDRVTALEKLVHEGKFQLTLPITLTCFGNTKTIR